MNFDAQLLWDNTEGCGDIAFVSGDFKRGKPIETAVYLSLFCDAKMTDYSKSTDPDSKRGWWGDLVSDGNHVLGSNIWEYERSKLDQGTINIIKSYCEIALQWMVSDGIVSKIEVDAELSNEQIESPKLALSIRLYKGDDVLANIRYGDFWNAQIDD